MALVPWWALLRTFHLAAPAALLLSSAAQALTPDDAAHLLGRTSFGADTQEMAAYLPLTREQAVERLLDSLTAPPYLQPPRFVSQPRPNYWGHNWESNEVIFYRINEIQQLQSGWMQEMIETPTPFADRLALFWHGHFVSRFQNTRISAPFYDQLQVFRQWGGRNFRELLRAILRDPMMLSGLDNVQNTRSHPNENLARELMELFTLGVGNYTEQDVKTVARLLAGHSVERENGWRYRLNEADADSGEKTILGRTLAAGKTDAIDDLVDILLAQPQTAEFIAKKFFLDFVAPQPDPQEITRLAAILRDSDYDLTVFLRALLSSDAFWRPQNRLSLIKSPLELIVGFARTTQLRMPDYKILVDYADMLGQSAFMAPDVSGWKGGNHWLSISSLVNRARVMRRLWVAVAQSRQYPPDVTAGLRLRFSSEYRATPARFTVNMDGVPVGTITAAAGLRTLEDEKASNESGALKPMWENAVIPLPALPANPRSMTIEFIPPDTDTHLFINWIALNGRRYSPMNARWVGAERGRCPTDVPRGAFYCPAKLQFDLTPIDNDQATLADLHAPLNANIEYGTAHLQLTPTTGDRPHGLPARASDTTPAPVLIQTAQDIDRLREEAFRAYTFDPAYHLK